jgi:hypothetical protein
MEKQNHPKNTSAVSAANTPEIDEKLIELANDPMLEERFLLEIDRTVKKDKHIVKIKLHTDLSTLVKDENGKSESLNLNLKGPSSVGKSHTVVQISSYLPPENFILIGKQSPKVLTHEHGIPMTCTRDGIYDPENDKPFNLEPPMPPNRYDGYRDEKDFSEAVTRYRLSRIAWDKNKRKSYHWLNLDFKIMVFLESVNPETFEMLKAIMSHDCNRLVYKFVDEKGNNHVTLIEGAPAFVFCSLDKSYNEENVTRNITATPEISPEKINDANKLTNERLSNPWGFSDEKIETKLFKKYFNCLFKTVQSGQYQFIAPFTKLFSDFPKEVPKDMRNFQHFAQLLKTYPLLNLYQRPIMELNGKKYVLATVKDVIDARKLFDELRETTETGTDKSTLDFYHSYVEPLTEPKDLEYFVDTYNKNHPNRRSGYSKNKIRNMLKRLCTLNYVEKRPDPTDKRKDCFIPLNVKTVENFFNELSGNCLNYENNEEYARTLELDFKNWLEQIVNSDAKIRLYRLQLNGEPIELTIEETINVLSYKQHNKQLISKDNLSLELQNKVKISLEQQNTQVLPILDSEDTIAYATLHNSNSHNCFADECEANAEFAVFDDTIKQWRHYCHNHFRDTGQVLEYNGFNLKEHIIATNFQ